jgi:hypothetical protein
VEAEALVALQFFKPVLRGRVGGCRLGQALDSDVIASCDIRCEEHHAKGSMVKRGHSTETTIQKATLDEVVLEAFHGS